VGTTRVGRGSYAVGGMQYVVTAAGGHGSFGTKVGHYVIAYALGQRVRPQRYALFG
jgi:glucose dehydrogenase